MVKKVKATKSARKAVLQVITRPTVVSFRITENQTQVLNAILKRDPATGVKSSNQLARKVLCDYLAGRLDYRNPSDKLQDLDIIGA